MSRLQWRSFHFDRFAKLGWQRSIAIGNFPPAKWSECESSRKISPKKNVVAMWSLDRVYNVTRQAMVNAGRVLRDLSLFKRE